MADVNGKTLVIIPTYNERANIERLLRKILKLKLEHLDVLVVDDNSPDGTADLVAEIKEAEPRVQLIRRAGKQGLGTAYVAGFKYALKHNYEFIFEMDADHSHDPKEIPAMLKKAVSHDLVIGSRYQKGVNVINWPFSRLLISLAANWYTRLVSRMPIRDCTSGYKCFRREVLTSINLDRISSNGYSFQIEMAYKAWRRNFRIVEHSIIFFDRTHGTSKMNHKIMWEAVLIVWRLRFLSLLHKVERWLAKPT